MEPSDVLSPAPEGQAQGLLWRQLTWCFPGCAATLRSSAEEGQHHGFSLAKCAGEGTRASGKQPREVAGASSCSSLRPAGLREVAAQREDHRSWGAEWVRSSAGLTMGGAVGEVCRRLRWDRDWRADGVWGRPCGLWQPVSPPRTPAFLTASPPRAGSGGFLRPEVQPGCPRLGMRRSYFCFRAARESRRHLHSPTITRGKARPGVLSTAAWIRVPL